MTKSLDFLAVCVLVLAFAVWKGRSTPAAYGYSQTATWDTIHIGCAYVKCNGSGYCDPATNYTQCANCSNPNACRFDCIQCPSPRTCYQNHSCVCPDPWLGNVTASQPCNQTVCRGVCSRGTGAFCNATGYCACESGVGPGGLCLASCSPGSCGLSTACSASTAGSRGTCRCVSNSLSIGTPCDTRCDVGGVGNTSCVSGAYCSPSVAHNGTCAACPSLQANQTGCADAGACVNSGCAPWTSCGESVADECGCTPWDGFSPQSCSHSECAGQCGTPACTNDGTTSSECFMCSWQGGQCASCADCIESVESWLLTNTSATNCSAALANYPSSNLYLRAAQFTCSSLQPPWPVPSEDAAYVALAACQWKSMCGCNPSDLTPIPVGATCAQNCGFPGLPCAVPSSCDGSGFLTNCTCPANGTLSSGAACDDSNCPGACAPDTLCSAVSGTCQSCGVVGQDCCDPPAEQCDAGAVCQSGTCVACGMVGQTCCASSSCNAGAVCQSGTCVACGNLTQPCCSGSVQCTAPASYCSSGTCACTPDRSTPWPAPQGAIYVCNAGCDATQCGSPVCPPPPAISPLECYRCAPFNATNTACSFGDGCVSSLFGLFAISAGSCEDALESFAVPLYLPSATAVCNWSTLFSWPPPDTGEFWLQLATSACVFSEQGACSNSPLGISSWPCFVGCDDLCQSSYTCTQIGMAPTNVGQCLP